MNREKLKKEIKDSYAYNFSLIVHNEEADFIIDTMLAHMRESMSILPGFSEKAFEKYMSGSNLHLTFSPGAIFDAIDQTTAFFGGEEFKINNKFKRAREMHAAATLVLAHKKLTGEEWEVYSQDNPDIIMFRVGDRDVKEKFLNGVHLEIMRIPGIEKQKWQKDFNAELSEFIKEKKFNKRYADRCGLLVVLDFNHENLDLLDLNRKVNAISGNPYAQIWVVGAISPDLSRSMIVQIHPTYTYVEIDSISDRNLLY